MTRIELCRKGFQALVDALGYADAVRFIHLLDSGKRDYTQERHQWLDNVSREQIFADIKKIQNNLDDPNQYNEIIN
ncbi:hypothetical protein [Nostoc sp.]|uniref:hypothetical protein n=1 Tax=Nostoc sp. TaxID=1180 RepID=UPI002FF6E803